MTEQIYSFCRGCVSYCGLKFEVDDNRIIAVAGNADNLVSRGYKCIKGDMSVEFLRGREPRFTQSQRRDTDGELKPIATQQMLDEVAAAIAAGIERHGPQSIALYIGTAGYRKSFNLSMAKQFMGMIGSPLMFSTMTIDQSAHWVVEGRMGTFATGRPFFQDTDVMLFSGTNPVIAHAGPYQPGPLVNHTVKFREFKARGGKIIVVDPRKTETARQATLHIQPRPGTDTEIFAGLIRIILENNWHDREFCARYVTNLDALKKAVAPYTPEFVAERADIPVAQLLEAAQIIAAAKRISAGFGTGTSMSPNPNTAAHMIEGLNAICGGFARAGDVAQNPGVFARRPLVEAVNPPRRSWESEPRLESGYGTLYGEFPSSRIPDEILKDGPAKIRTLIVMGANPMMAFGQPDRMRQALQALDCLIVIEPRHTETTALADYVVAPSLQYEVEDFNIMTASWTEDPIVQYSPPVVQPPPGVIEEWQFFNGLANRLGITLRLAPFGFGASNTDTADVLALDPASEWTTTQLIDRTLRDNGLSLDALKQHPHGWKLDTKAQVIAAATTDDGARLDVCPPDVADELREIFASQPASDRKYQLTCRRIIELMNSEFRFGESTQQRYRGAAPLFVNPDDMAQDGLSAGDRVVVTGEHGRITAHIRPDASLRRGVVAMPHSWSGESEGDPAGGHTSWLVSLREEHVQKIDGMPQQSSIPVDIARAS